MPKPDDDSEFDDDEDESSATLHLSKESSIMTSSDFETIISDMITSGYQENNPPENVILEIKGYKFAQNKVYVWSF